MSIRDKKRRIFRLELIEERIRESIKTKELLLDNKEILKKIEDASQLMIEAFQDEGKVLLCGNGGSASDAMHIAGELIGRFQKERQSLPAIALPLDASSMTAISNDYSYEEVFVREVEGLMTNRDVLIGISTSGKSINIFRAMERAHEIGGKTIALSGRDGGTLREIAEISIIVPSDVTARIQEAHILIGHILCEIVENSMS